MTTRHMLEGVMQWTRARSFNRLSVVLGLSESTISRMNRGEQRCLNMCTVDHIHLKSGVPFDQLFAWYRMPDDAVLGRITKERPRDG